MKSPIILLIAFFTLAFTQAQAGEPLVTTQWAAENLDNPLVRFVEVSVEPGKFERGHIPGAVNLRWHTDLVDPVRRDVVQPQRFQDLLSLHGIGNETTVVLYGDHNNWFAAWGAWIFTKYGHENVKILDGGRDKWERERRPVSNRPATYTRTDYRISTVNDQVRASLQDVLAVVENEQEGALIDIRSAGEYEGRVIAPEGIQELAIRAGHIPGAVNVPWGDIVDPRDGTFLPKEQIRRIYAEKGIDGSKPVITYCRIGERSSHTWFALHFLLGYETRNYDGSWTEYGNAVGVPINNPAGTVWTGK
jgi:thiosulfate/3-mercaptopyruvate sulfurtransferase